MRILPIYANETTFSVYWSASRVTQLIKEPWVRPRDSNGCRGLKESGFISFGCKDIRFIKLEFLASFQFLFLIFNIVYLFLQVEMLQDKVGEKDVIIKTSYTLETLGIYRTVNQSRRKGCYYQDKLYT